MMQPVMLTNIWNDLKVELDKEEKNDLLLMWNIAKWICVSL